jgi:hypothetical protein
VLELRERSVLVYECLPMGRRDRHGLDRRLACGAVLANVRLAIRTESRAVTVRFATDPDRPDLVAQLSVGDTLPPTMAEADQYAVINGVRPARTVAADIPHTAAWCPGVELRPLVRTRENTAGGEFVVLTVDDGRLDRVRAGAVTQSACLAAAAAGLAVHPTVNLLRVPELRAGLIERLMLPGYPQVLLRVGGGKKSTVETGGRELC